MASGWRRLRGGDQPQLFVRELRGRVRRPFGFRGLPLPGRNSQLHEKVSSVGPTDDTPLGQIPSLLRRLGKSLVNDTTLGDLLRLLVPEPPHEYPGSGNEALSLTPEAGRLTAVEFRLGRRTGPPRRPLP